MATAKMPTIRRTTRPQNASTILIMTSQQMIHTLQEWLVDWHLCGKRELATTMIQTSLKVVF